MDVVLYSTHCPKCNILEKKLKEKNIVFKEINDVEEMISKGFMTAPILSVEDRIMDFSDSVKWVNNQ